jgi:nitrogen fixation protein NifB
MLPDISTHPCFNIDARHRHGRVHLPIAPDCNVQCNFCKRIYDCANESRPGVTTAVLSPRQSLDYLQRVLAKDSRITVVGIAGPGDPFATPSLTLETLGLVRQSFPEMLLCVASNGLGLPPHAEALARLAVSHVTLTVNAVDPQIGAKVYAWIRDGKKVYRGVAGAELIWSRQAEAIRMLKEHDVVVKINTIIIPGVNDDHVVDVARQVADLGADIANCVPLYPVQGTPFGELETPPPDRVAAIRADVAQLLPIMSHCTRCRADAVGLLGEAKRPEMEIALLQAASSPLNPAEDRPYVAVATLEGVLVNQHLGEADQLSIYAREEAGFRIVEQRRTPPAGNGSNRWAELADTLQDCRAVLVASAGNAPREALVSRGIKLVMMEGLIDEGLDAVFRGEEIRAPLRKNHRCGSGAGCSGNGQGCS